MQYFYFVNKTSNILIHLMLCTHRAGYRRPSGQARLCPQRVQQRPHPSRRPQTAPKPPPIPQAANRSRRAPRRWHPAPGIGAEASNRQKRKRQRKVLYQVFYRLHRPFEVSLEVGEASCPRRRSSTIFIALLYPPLIPALRPVDSPNLTVPQAYRLAFLKGRECANSMVLEQFTLTLPLRGSVALLSSGPRSATITEGGSI